MAKLKEVIKILEEWAPVRLQESYDNSGLQVGRPDADVERALVSLDITPEVIEEAKNQDCQLIITHHPLIFKPLKKLTGANIVEECVELAIKYNIALYAIHTNLDNVQTGVNKILADKLGLQETQILQTGKEKLQKLVFYVPHASKEKVVTAMFAAGAGKIGNYDECSFSSQGEGSFRPLEGSQPAIGTTGKRHTEPETRVEMLVQASSVSKVIRSMKQTHPYEEVAYDLFEMQNINPNIGSGMIGSLASKMSKMEFLQMLKEKLHCSAVQFTKKGPEEIQHIAICGGSGSFLISAAKSAGADAFITGDITYHSYFDATDDFMIVNVGHYESEQFTPEGIIAEIRKKMPTFALLLSTVQTNPVNTL